MPEVLPDTILFPLHRAALATEEKAEPSAERETSEYSAPSPLRRRKGCNIAYRLARGFHRLLAQIRETIQRKHDRSEARRSSVTKTPQMELAG